MRITWVILGILCFGSVVVVIDWNIGWTELEPDAPVSSKTFDPHYETAAREALLVLVAARRDLGVPSISAAVGIQGELVWAGAVGWANVEEGTSATPDTRYRIGSTSKSLTTIAMARLYEAGTLEIDVPIETYASNLPNSDWNRITLRQLSSHTAGLVGYEENRDLVGLFHSLWLQSQYDDVADSLDIFDDTDLLYEPGTNFHYSSFDINLVSAILQAAAGKPYLDIMKTEVFEPLQMNATSADYVNRDLPNRAIFYERDGNSVKPWRSVNLSQKWAGGGLLSTSSDLVRLGLGWLSRGFLSMQTVELWWTPQQLSNGEVNPQSYAIGWRSDSRDDLTSVAAPIHRVHHGGVSKGSMSWLVIYPELEMAVALNINARANEFSDFSRFELPITQAFLRLLSM